MKTSILCSLFWLAISLGSRLMAQAPLKLESVKLSREVALQKLRVQDNVSLRQYFTKAGFKESDAIDAQSYKGTDSEGEFQMDVVAKELVQNGKKAVVTTVEFRQAGKVTVLTAADAADGSVVQAQPGGTRVLYAASSVTNVASCALSKLSGSAACQTCRAQIRTCILSPQSLNLKIQCLFRTYASSNCTGCAKTSILSLVGCLLS
jgi:hypothetical protein